MMRERRPIFPPDNDPAAPDGNLLTPWQLWQPFAVLLLAFLAADLLPSAVTGWLSPLHVSCFSLLVQDLIFFGGPLLIVCGYYRSPGSFLGLGHISLRQLFSVGIPAGVCLYALNLASSFIINLLFPGRIAESQNIIALFGLSGSLGDTLILAVLICIVAPLAEEMLFRAFLYPPLKRLCGRVWGIIFSGALFALIHMNAWTFIPLCIGGIGFTWLYDRYGSLWLNFCAHLIWNGIVLLFYFIV